MLEIKGLCKLYGGESVLDNFEMEVGKGQIFGLIGSNGAGKSTVIKILAGIMNPDKGRVLIEGKPLLSNADLLKRTIGYIPDHFGTYPNLTVKEYMEFFSSAFGLRGLKGRDRWETLLDQVGMRSHENDFVETLSRGMKQRVCLARVLIHEPRLLLMDEPVAGMDPVTRSVVKEMLKRLKEEGMTVIISSHVLTEMTDLCTHIGIMDRGQMLVQGEQTEVFRRINMSNPLHMMILEGRDQAVSLLKRDPSVKSISIEGGHFALQFDGDEQDESNLLSMLVDSGIRIQAFYREPGSLESLFMEVTKERSGES